MGIVQSQSAKNLVTTYLGFIIGAINTILLYPHFLGKTYYGVVMAVMAAGSLISTLINLGMPDTLIKFFSGYKTEEEKRRLLGMALITPLCTGALAGLLSLFFYSYVQAYFAKNPEIDPFIYLIFVIAITEAYFKIFFNWGRIKLKSTFGNFMREVFQRIWTLLLLLMVYWDWIGIRGFMFWMGIIYVVRTLVMMGYAFYLLPPSISFKLPHNFSRVLKYTVLILIAGFASNVLLDLDKTMISHFMDVDNVSVYAIAVFIVTVIEVPVKAMRQITHPITANLINTKQWTELDRLYKKSSITLFIAGGFLFAIILANAEQVYGLFLPDYRISMVILGLLALIKLSRNLLGVGGSILKNSDYYRLLLIASGVTVILAFVLNYIMIPIWGLYGAAVASLASYFVYDFLKVWFVYKKFKTHPFDKHTVLLALFITVFTGVFYFVQFHSNPILGIAIKSILMSGIYAWVVYKLNFSEDVNLLMDKYLKKIGLKK